MNNERKIRVPQNFHQEVETNHKKYLVNIGEDCKITISMNIANWFKDPYS